MQFLAYHLTNHITTSLGSYKSNLLALCFSAV